MVADLHGNKVAQGLFVFQVEVGTNVDDTPRWRGIARVDNQVQKDAVQLVAVDEYFAGLIGMFNLQRIGTANRGLQQRQKLIDCQGRAESFGVGLGAATVVD